MRIPLTAAALLALASPLARADAPPDGTQPLTLYEGDKQPVQAPNGSQVFCDNPAVARGSIVEDSFVLIAGQTGTTLCAVRYDGANRGLYLVTVKSASEKPKDTAPKDAKK